MTTEITRITNRTCLAARFASFSFFFPIYWEQIMHPPAASAAKAWITSIFMASTRETADMAAGPTLLTITVSTVPIRELRTCSMIRGSSRAFNAALLNICLFSCFLSNFILPFRHQNYLCIFAATYFNRFLSYCPYIFCLRFRIFITGKIN